MKLIRLVLAFLGCVAIFAGFAATVEMAPGSTLTLVCKTEGAAPPPPPPPPPVTPTTCPTPGPHKVVNYPYSGTPYQLKQVSGYITAFEVIPAIAPKASVTFSQGQTPWSPGGTVEFSVSKCPGVIDSAGGYCYKSAPGGMNFTTMTIFRQPTNYGWDSQAEIGPRGCWAPASEGKWYINVRHTYTDTCAGGCGYSIKWEAGGY